MFIDLIPLTTCGLISDIAVAVYDEYTISFKFSEQNPSATSCWPRKWKCSLHPQPETTAQVQQQWFSCFGLNLTLEDPIQGFVVIVKEVVR